MTTKRKWLLRIGLAVCGLGLVAVGGIYTAWARTRSRGEARRDEAVRALDAADPGWRIDDLCAARNRNLPPDDRNAAVQLIAAQKRIPKQFKDWSSRPDYLTLVDFRPPNLPDPDDLRGMKDVHAACANVLPELRATRLLSEGGVPVVMDEPSFLSTATPHLMSLRECAAVLDLDATVLAADGRADEAVEASRAILGCARATGDDPTLIAQLVRMAVAAIAVRSAERALGWGTPSASLAVLQGDLSREITVPRLTHGLRGERGGFYHLLDNLAAGRLYLEEIDGPKRSKPDVWERASQIWYRNRIPAQQAMMLDLFNEAIAADRLSGPERRAAFDHFVESFPPQSGDTILVRLLMPSIPKVTFAEDLNRAKLSCAVTAVACERYRLRHGTWPAALDAVPKDILPEVPTDPYVGGPVRYRLTDDGAVVYATGPDLSDDGGDLLDPKGSDGTDLGFRLFNPDQRRRPAPPKPDTAPAPNDP